ncbi:MAG: preprotein translocase subunit SecE [Planctomycetota bacterium]
MDLTIKKKDQGTNTRLLMGVFLGLIGAALVYAVYGWFVNRSFFGLEYANIYFNWGHVIGSLVALACIGVILWVLLFHERSVDFLVRVDREAKKVTWPTWEQLKNSVLVIVGVIVFFGIVAGAFDLIFMAGIWRGLLGLK